MKQPLASITSSAMVVMVALLTMSMRLTLTAADTLAELDAKLLHDIMHQYTEYIPTNTNKCPDSSDTTTFTDEWPDANPNVYWDPTTVQNYEEALFQTLMTHTDTTGNGRDWEVRFGKGGNIYSLFTPNLYGEAMPPQAHADAPWVDEVHQLVSVNGELNNPQGIKYYLHQAGAYQRDSPYTDDKPFHSPSLAKHCEANYCMFASWGTSAHVATRFTSPIIYMNKYTNCGNGIIQHDLMIHNFADPMDSVSLDVDQTYFNVVWTGARTSNLPHVLEPDRATGILNYQDPDDNDALNLKSWGNDGPTSVRNGCDAITSEIVNIDQLRGYSAFVGNGLLVKEPELKRSCRVPSTISPDCYTDEANCMVDECRCDNGDAAWDGYTEIDLFVPADASPNCKYHTANHQNPADGRYYINVGCDLHDFGFGNDRTYRSDEGMQLCRSDTGACFDTPYIRSWSWKADSRKAYFATEFYAEEKNCCRPNLPNCCANKTIAETTTTAFFNNLGSNTQRLNIEFRQKVPNEVITPPPDYDPGSLPALTYVYGTGEDYVKNVDGFARRRAGTSSRDFTVFTINWMKNNKDDMRFEPGETYSNRQFLISSNLTHVQAMADDLVPEVEVREWTANDYSPRKVDLYWQASSFSAVAASTVQGNTTSCPSSAQLATDCQGYSTPKLGHVAYFYITCGAQTHLGPDPYHFTPGSYITFTFPAHASTADSVRAYLCKGQDPSIRPTWKLLGFFPKTCSSLASATYDDTICQPTSVTEVPTSNPSKSPSKSPSDSPVTDVPTSNPSTSPVTEVPTSNPTKGPSPPPTTQAPVTPAPVTPSPTKTPTTAPVTSAPSKVPTVKPVTDSPSKVPTVKPVTDSPSKVPTVKPVTDSPSKVPTVKPVTDSPSKVPTVKPVTESPIVSKSPSKSVTTSSSCNFEVMLHIVDQTKSLCQNKKVSCKVAISDGTYIDGLEVRVAEMDAQDIIPHEASVYFDEADSTTMAVASDDDGCISHTPAADGMVNVAVACGTFKMNDQPVGQRVCALSDDLVTVVEGGKVTMEFMLLVLKDKPSNNPRAAKSKRAKGSGGFNRFLQEGGDGSDLVVTFPQSFIWESSEELYYPMILSSLTVWTVDACLLLPPGHVLTAVMDANSTEPLLLDGECTHVTVPGEDLVLLFQPVEDIPWGSRALANKKSATDDIRGHIKATEKGGKHSKGQSKTIEFSTKARGRSNAKGKGAQGAGD